MGEECERVQHKLEGSVARSLTCIHEVRKLHILSLDVYA